MSKIVGISVALEADKARPAQGGHAGSRDLAARTAIDLLHGDALETAAAIHAQTGIAPGRPRPRPGMPQTGPANRPRCPGRRSATRRRASHTRTRRP